MSTSLKAKLFAAAELDAGLAALLGSAPFRWYDVQLRQGSAFPAVEVLLVSNPRTYVMAGRMPTGWARVQFTIFGLGPSSENADAVAQALVNFLGTFNAIGIPGLAVYPCQLVGDRDAGQAATQPLTYMRILDAMIFSNDTV